jgi:hypothetical protein
MATDKKILLYYKDRCVRCRDLSRFIVWSSARAITRIPIEYDESIINFYDSQPRANGYPVLFLGHRPVYGVWVFLSVPVAILLSWAYKLSELFTKRKTYRHNEKGF